jgi:hypothetical protein
MTREERNAAKRARYAMRREQECKKKREWYAANRATALEYARRHRAKNGAPVRLAWSHWDADRVAKLRQMRADRIPYKECGRALNCTAGSCEKACARYGIPKRKVHQSREPVLAKHVARRRESDAQAAMWRKLLNEANP